MEHQASGFIRKDYSGGSFQGAYQMAWGYPISRLFRTRRYKRMVKEKEEMLVLLFLAVLAVLAEGPPNLLGVFKLLALEGSLSRSAGL